MIRRNKAPFIAAASVLAALCLGLGLATWLFFQERATRREEEILNTKQQAAQNMALAAVDVEAGEFSQAALKVLKIPPGSLFPSLHAAQVYRELGAHYAMQGQWTSATNFFAGLLQLDEDMNYFSARTIWDTLAAGSALVEAAKEPASAPYEQLRQAAIRRFADTTNALAAERLLRASLLRPANRKFCDPWTCPLRSWRIPFRQRHQRQLRRRRGAVARGCAALLEDRQSRWAAAAERCQSLPPGRQ